MRKTQTVTITAPGRDEGKTFLLTEMPASQAEQWAIRAVFAMGKSNVDIPMDAVYAGWAVVATVGLKALLGAPYDEARPLLDEMMACIQSVQESGTRPLIESDIAEISTRMFLRDEVFRLHANFSIRETLSSIRSVLASDRAPNITNTQTSDLTSD